MLLAVALEHFVLVVVRVLRGPTQADESAKKLRKLVHCQWCEERVFLKQGNMVDGGYTRCAWYASVSVSVVDAPSLSCFVWSRLELETAPPAGAKHNHCRMFFLKWPQRRNVC